MDRGHGTGHTRIGVREGVETTQSQVAATIAQLLGEDFLAESPKSAPPLPGVCISGEKSTPKSR